jgi:translation initiation factor IF-3
MDYGKWMYMQRKKEQKAKAHRHETEFKEIRIRTPKIGDHDLEIKINQARGFLSRGDRVQFTMRFRGRELAHTEEGRKVFEHITEALAEVSKVDQPFRFESRRLTMTLASTGKKPASAAAAGKAKSAAKAPSPAPTPTASAPAPTPAAPPENAAGPA